MKKEQIQLLKEALEDAKLVVDALERFDLSGSSPASGSRTREAGRKPDATTSHTTAPPFPDQGGGGAQRLERQWYEEEAEYKKYEEEWRDRGEPEKVRYYSRLASDLAIRRAQLRAALVAQPLTQSGAGDMEECPECRGVIIDSWHDGARACWMCKHIWTRGKDRERSGSGNAKDLPPAEQPNDFES